MGKALSFGYFHQPSISIYVTNYYGYYLNLIDLCIIETYKFKNTAN